MARVINYRYTIGLAATISIGFFILGYSFSWFNTVTLIMHEQYVYHDKYVIEDRDIFNFIVSALIPVGAIVGTPLGGCVATSGRRKAIIVFGVLWTVGSVLTSIFNFFALIIGRFLLGVSVGAFAWVSPLFIAEFAPKSIAGPLGIANQFSSVIGAGTVYILGFFVPSRDDASSMTTNMWRIIFILPGVVTHLQTLLMVFIFKYDTPKYYELKQDRANYKEVMWNVYVHNPFAVSEALNDTVEVIEQGADVSWSGLFARPHRHALIVGLVLSVFHQATGISSIFFYSNEIFTKGDTSEDSETAAKLGTLATAVVSLFGVVLAMYLLKFYGRKPLMLIGVFLLGLTHSWLIYFSSTNNSLMIKICTIWFVFVFNSSFGGILWVYASEILSARGVSLVAQINMIAVFLFGSMGNLMFKYLTSPGVHSFYAVVQILSFIFIFKCIKETKGLSKSMWETLYFPRDTNKTYLEIADISELR